MFQIIADSACDLTLERAKELNVQIVPFYVSMDGTTYKKEAEELSVRDFYRFMVDFPNKFPKTSLPSLEDYENAFRPHVETGRGVLCLCFTGKMSGGVGSARNAKEILLEEYPDADIEVMDTRAATVSEALTVLNAVAMRDAGYTLEQTLAWLEGTRPTNQIFFTDGNLDYLIKGGRIGKATGRAANILNIKPMIIFKEGEVDSVSIARGRQKSMEKVIDLLLKYLEERKANPDDYGVMVGYGYDEEEGKRLRMQLAAALRAKYPKSACEVDILQIGATISTHNGPYPLGVGVIRKWRPTEK